MTFFHEVGMILPILETKTMKNTNFTNFGAWPGGGGFALMDYVLMNYVTFEMDKRQIEVEKV